MMTQKRICIIADRNVGYSSGSTMRVLNGAKALRNAGHRVAIVSFLGSNPKNTMGGIIDEGRKAPIIPIFSAIKTDSSESCEGIRFYSIRDELHTIRWFLDKRQGFPFSFFYRTLVLFLAAFIAIRKEKPDVIYAHLLSAGMVGILLGGLFRIRVVYDIHGFVHYECSSKLQSGVRWVEEQILKRSNALTTASEALTERLKKKYDNVRTIHGIVPKKRVTVDGKLRERLGSNNIVIGYAGHTSPCHGFYQLAEGFRNLIKKRGDVKLLLHGVPTLFEGYHLPEDKVIYLEFGDYDRLFEILKTCDILVTTREPSKLAEIQIPQKLSDYVATGKPILASDTGENGRIVKKYHLGLAVEPTPEGMQNGLEKIIKEKEKWSEYSKNALKFADENLHLNVVGKKIEKALFTG